MKMVYATIWTKSCGAQNWTSAIEIDMKNLEFYYDINVRTEVILCSALGGADRIQQIDYNTQVCYVMNR